MPERRYVRIAGIREQLYAGMTVDGLNQKLYACMTVDDLNQRAVYRPGMIVDALIRNCIQA